MQVSAPAAQLSPGAVALHRACRAGAVEAIEAALSTAAGEINTADADGWSALLCAAESGSVACVRALLKHGSDARTATHAGNGTLHLLVKYGASTRLAEHSTAAYSKVLRTLIERGAPVTPNRHGETPLHIATRASNLVALELLLKGTPVDVEHRSAAKSGGVTPLQLASRSGLADAAALLIKHGADINSLCTSGETARQLAAAGSHAECERLLFSRGHDTVQLAAALRGHDNKRVLAILATHPRLAETFVDNEQRTVLHYLCAKPDLAAVRTLLEHNRFAVPLIDKCDVHGRTPLHAACAAFDYRLIVLLLDHANDAGQSCADR